MENAQIIVMVGGYPRLGQGNNAKIHKLNTRPSDVGYGVQAPRGEIIMEIEARDDDYNELSREQIISYWHECQAEHHRRNLEVSGLRKALEFYADEEIYYYRERLNSDWFGPNAADKDSGETARVALNILPKIISA